MSWEEKIKGMENSKDEICKDYQKNTPEFL